MNDKRDKANNTIYSIFILFVVGISSIIYLNKNTEKLPESKIEEKIKNGEFGKTDNAPLNTVDNDAMFKELRTQDSIDAINNKKRNATIKNILSKFRKETDEVTGTEFYYDKSTSKYFTNGIYLYLGKEGSNYYLRLKIQYTADDWLFINNVQLRSGDQLIDYAIKSDFERDNSGGTIYEWYDTPVEMEEEQLITNIILNEKNILRLSGDQYRHDIKLSQKQRNAIANLWHAKNEITMQ